jgi:hypothetical protein
MNAVHNGHRPGSNTPLLHTLKGLVDDMDGDTAALIAAASHIRASISALRRSSRSPVYQQTNEEWLRAYDSAEVARQPQPLGGPL